MRRGCVAAIVCGGGCENNTYGAEGTWQLGSAKAASRSADLFSCLSLALGETMRNHRYQVGTRWARPSSLYGGQACYFGKYLMAIRI